MSGASATSEDDSEPVFARENGAVRGLGHLTESCIITKGLSRMIPVWVAAADE